MTPPLSEAAWQSRVVDYARMCGWWVLHHPDSRRATAAGWPDLTLIRDRLLLAELKTARGRLSPAQQHVHGMLRDVGIEIHVWRPTDWPDVMELLARERR